MYYLNNSAFMNFSRKSRVLYKVVFYTGTSVEPVIGLSRQDSPLTPISLRHA
jgi:hypothetical protein